MGQRAFDLASFLMTFHDLDLVDVGGRRLRLSRAEDGGEGEGGKLHGAVVAVGRDIMMM